MPFTAYRNQFPFTNSKIYLNHAGVSPLSTDVREKMDWFINNRSFGEIEFFEEMVELRDQTRSLLAKIINVEENGIAFTANTSTGFNWLAQGLKWKKGDQIILTDLEFPSNVYPFLNLQKQGVEVVFVKSKNGCIEVEDIEKAITPKTRMISISFVEFSTGYRNDLLAIGALSKHHDLIFSVDAIQGLGAIPLDVKACHIDFLSCGGHKWLMGPMGIGFMYFEQNLFEKISPAFVGWDSVTNSLDYLDYNFELLPDARRFEYATQNHLGICGLSASLDILHRVGIATIEQHLLILGKQMVDRLPDYGMKFLGHEDSFYWSGIFSFSHPDAEELSMFLKKHNVICSIRDGALRFSPHFYNNRDDINAIIDLIGKFHRSHL
ncbi:MAG: aminotransferase class V-fold PLP-dependent enzyme [Calditrichaeota bacterium]|nr:MAG: aminotransferase class V-fold PLP-dependent enzyme [Calditrichota bacterium]MBL1206683.1 aminotransferase class V-fold PLP-dependent enzyme [Calditrichota bacterium]NOG46510.1 aminotransferase class V-fold PLP-dependent enzyme [Calditrichota bacterium]